MNRINSLDGLRAVAVLLVYFYHLLEIAKVDLPSIFHIGWLGVDLFFVLSGFFIGLAVLRPDVWNPRAFIKNRAKRIIPAYYVSVILIVTFIAPVYIVTENGLLNTLSHLAFVHTWFIETHGAINGAYWTLGVEVFFYLLMLLFAPLFRKSTRSFFFVIAAWCLITYLWRIYVFNEPTGDGFKRFFLATQLLGMLDEFSVGIVVAYIWNNTSFFKDASLKLILVVLTAAILVMISGTYNLLKHLGDFWYDFTTLVFLRTWIAIGFGLFLVFMLLASTGVMEKLIKYSFLAYTGKISYSIYLYHIPVILSVSKAGKDFGLNSSEIILVTTLCTWLVSSLSYHLVEYKWHKS